MWKNRVRWLTCLENRDECDTGCEDLNTEHMLPQAAQMAAAAQTILESPRVWRNSSVRLLPRWTTAGLCGSEIILPFVTPSQVFQGGIENEKNSRTSSCPPRSEQNSYWLQVLSPAFRTDLSCSRLGSTVSIPSVKKHELEAETRTQEESLPGVWDESLCALPRATWKIAKWEEHPWGTV